MGAVGLAQIGAQAVGLAARVLDLFHNGVGFLRVGAVVDQDLGASLRQRHSRRSANATGGAGNESGLTIE